MNQYNALIAQVSQQIQAEEDKRIFEALDAAAGTCWDITHHPGVPEVRRIDCPHESCWITDIMES